MPVTVKVRVDQRALDKQLRDRDGAVGRIIAGFAGVVTREIHGVFRERAGGVWWRARTTIGQGTRGTYSVTTIKRSQPHPIDAKRAPNLVFFWERERKLFVGPHVNHPGSAPPEKLVLSGIDRASRHIKFTAAAPTFAEK
jgi:hypothetical protein